ncbi:YciI family protein [Curtobacterium sp. DN_7.5]|uniref:YciI family protein n=1 Tax=Curtobacterium sp. DN_7.5 TaxID=3049047 RepID=UPI001F584E62|nr:YciI family protein [Curtobacterium sp. DN_7.5]
MRFLVNVIDDGQAVTIGRTASATEAEAAAVDALNERLDRDGSIVLAVGLAAPSDATVVDARGDEPVVRPGPVLDVAEYVAGFWVLELPDAETALRTATEASRACNRKVELRPVL